MGEVVTVVRKDHPYGRVDIDIFNLKDTDEIYDENKKVEVKKDVKPTKPKKG